MKYVKIKKLFDEFADNHHLVHDPLDNDDIHNAVKLYGKNFKQYLKYRNFFTAKTESEIEKARWVKENPYIDNWRDIGPNTYPYHDIKKENEINLKKDTEIKQKEIYIEKKENEAIKTKGKSHKMMNISNNKQDLFSRIDDELYKTDDESNETEDESSRMREIKRIQDKLYKPEIGLYSMQIGLNLTENKEYKCENIYYYMMQENSKKTEDLINNKVQKCDIKNEKNKNAPEKKVYSCMLDGCNRKYTSYFGLKYHMRTGHSEAKMRVHKPFVCTMEGCERKYKNKNGLQYHLRRMHDFE